METILSYISVVGAFVLAISGALSAMRKNFDAFGVLIIAFVTATGGGTLRDIMIDGKSVFWLAESYYIYAILLGSVVAVIFRHYLSYLLRTLFFFDTIGLALYTVAGVQIGINFQLGFLDSIILGTITGAFGGVLRDILVGDIPVVFHKEVYATISLLGGALFYLLFFYLGEWQGLSKLLPLLFMIAARFLVVYYKVHFPCLSLQRSAGK